MSQSLPLTRREFVRTLGATLAGGALSASALRASARPPITAHTWAFDVFLGSRRIGQHRVALEQRDNDLIARTEVDLTVRMLFITLVDMRHRSEERWRGDRLVALRSRTTDGGETYEVLATAVPEGLRVRSEEGEAIAPPDAGSSNALWRPDTLRKRQLVDAQSGGVIGLVAERQGEEEIEVGRRRRPAVRYSAITPSAAGLLWYADRRLVKARLEIRGQTVDYRLVV